MKNLASIWNRPPTLKPSSVFTDWPLQDQPMGIEVEVDTYNQSGVVLPASTPQFKSFWNDGRDGSLIAGVEYTLRSPMRGSQLAEAIYLFFNNGTKLTKPTTSSTHIHMDMMDEETNTTTVQNLVMLVFMLEAGIFAYASPAREWCGYTNSLSTAPDALLATFLSRDIDAREGDLKKVCNNGIIGRYYGLNLQALHKYGSVEFRYFPTATSAEELTEWVMLVQSFKKAALQLHPMIDVAPFLQDEQQYSDFLTYFFPKWAEHFLKTVPLEAARANYGKALAIHAAHNGGQTEVFNGDAVTKNKKISKFFKVKKVTGKYKDIATVEVCFTNENVEAPRANRQSPTTLLISYDAVYAPDAAHQDYWECSDREANFFIDYNISQLRIKLREKSRAWAATREEDMSGWLAASADGIDRFVSKVVRMKEARDMLQRERTRASATAQRQAAPPPGVPPVTLPLRSTRRIRSLDEPVITRGAANPVNWEQALYNPTPTEAPPAAPLTEEEEQYYAQAEYQRMYEEEYPTTDSEPEPDQQDNEGEW